MPMPERYHEVFISSTYVDLIEERQAVLQTLLKMNCLPIGMELFPNGDPDVWKLIQSLIARCDLYILIVGGRYGSRSSDGDLSFTHREYLEAERLGKKILVYPHMEPEAHNPNLWAKQSKKDRAALGEFRSLVSRQSTSPWKGTDHLRANLAIDLVTRLREVPAGWTRVPENVVKTFDTEIKAVESRFESVEIKDLTRLLQNTLHQFQFNRTKARIEKLGEILPWLSKKEWDLLVDFARAQAMIRADAATPANQPMKQSIIDMVARYQAQLHNYESGVIEVEGELINAVSGYFISAVTSSFRALSNNDFDFWRKKESKPYYRYTLDLIKKGLTVERIFVVPKRRLIDPVVHKVIREQVGDGVHARIISTNAIRVVIPSRLDRDFGLHDSIAVSFFRNYYGRSYKVDTRKEEVNRFNKWFADVAKNSEIVPGKTAGDIRVFDSVAEFDAWVQVAPERLAAATAADAEGETARP